MSPQAAGQSAPPAAGPDQGGWAGRGFTRPGPGVEVPRDLYRAALQDALAYTTDRDGCGECDRGRLCETHASRASRAEQYQQALEQQMETRSWATQAILDAINSGQLRAELLEDCDFWVAKAARQRMQAEANVETDHVGQGQAMEHKRDGPGTEWLPEAGT